MESALRRHWLVPMALAAAVAALALFHLGASRHAAAWVWLCGGLLIVLSVYQAILNLKMDARRLRRHIMALEALTENSNAISSQILLEKDLWDRLSQSARNILGASIASVAILDGDNGKVRMVASRGATPSLDGMIVDIENVLTINQCIHERRIITVQDVFKADAAVNKQMAQNFGVASIMQVPLIAEGKVFGAMMLGWITRHRFDVEEIQLAELWASQVAVTLTNAQLYRRMRHELEAREHYLRQRDMLFALNDLIIRVRKLDDLLHEIVEEAPATLEVDACQVCLLDDAGEQLQVAAITKAFAGQAAGQCMAWRGTAAEEVIAAGKIVTYDHIGQTTGQPIWRGLAAGGVACLPLAAITGKAVGVLVLMRQAAGTFSREQLDLARLFCSRAAAAIENAQLYQQIQRDADTKAMLLRELNHRVKNNLASIVTLLSLDEPRLSADAAQWLQRAIDRIEILARTHELFVTGNSRVDLRKLVEQTLGSLVARPNGVHIITEISPENVFLRNDRAIALAMILHELCYNAMRHGLRHGGGNITLRAAMTAGNIAIVDVIDDGAGEPGQIAFASNQPGQIPPNWGQGLRLVNSFVVRDLRGSLVVRPRQDCGTMARIEFAILSDELKSPGLQ